MNRRIPIHHGEKPKLKNGKKTLKRILSYLGKKKILIVLVLFFTIISTTVDVIGTYYSGIVINDFIGTGVYQELIKICVALIIMYVVAAITSYLQNRFMVIVAQRTSSSIRRDLFTNLLDLPLNYFDSNSSGDLMSRLTNDVDNINNCFQQTITQFFTGIISIIAYLIAMLITNPLLAIAGLITTPISFFVMRFVLKKTQPLFIKQQKILGNLNGYIEEKISGQKAVLLFQEESSTKEAFDAYNNDFTKVAIKAQGISGFMGPINNFIGNLAYLIIPLVGGLFIIYFNPYFEAHIPFLVVTAGAIYTMTVYLRHFNRPINDIFNLITVIQIALAGAERVFEVIDAKKEKDLDSAKDKYDYLGNVELKNVFFSYAPNKQILKDISLSARKGETIAIVGHTGAGKTTIINLLTKFYDIDSGSITFDGIDINDISRKSLRRSIALVLQDTFLFSESIKENIRYGFLPAKDEDVIEAAKMANAHNFIMQLPNGYDTILSDNGSNISQGQRQLLAIARAILSKSNILILDEATSSIDTKTEIEIQKALLKLMEGKTSFIIAHRLSTIRNATKIIVIDNGMIVEAGNHDSLISKNGFYANLYNSQFKNQEVITR